MSCKLKSKDIQELVPTNIISQTPFWGRVKQNQGFFPKGLELSVSKQIVEHSNSTLKRATDDILVLIKQIDNKHCYAYAPYGPEIEPVFENQGLMLEHISETLREYLPKNCIFIRYDLAWKNQWSVDDDFFDNRGNWLGPPENRVQEIRINYNTACGNLKKSAVDMLPKNTFFLDLTKNEDTLLSNMRFNTRYNIKQALKKGVQVKEYGIEHLDQWYNLYVETALRHNMGLQSPDYFSAILKNQDRTLKGVKVKMLMAEHEGEFLASMFLVLSKNRATYLYGASSTNKKNLSASYALQWESIKIAKNLGYTQYDMFGSAPNLEKTHPLHGVHIYKKGFGGELFHTMGCWDYPYNLAQYNVFRLNEQNR